MTQVEPIKTIARASPLRAEAEVNLALAIEVIEQQLRFGRHPTARYDRTRHFNASWDAIPDPKGNPMRRREFITLLGGAAAWPLAARAQQSKQIQRIGVLLFGSPDTDPNLGAFLRGLRDLGYIEAQNIAIEYRYAEGKPERLRSLAARTGCDQPDLIFALGGDVAPSARVATNTIPIVVAVSNDPVQAGLVASLAHPGGNITGVTFVSSDLAAKRLQFLREIAPNLVPRGGHLESRSRRPGISGNANCCEDIGDTNSIVRSQKRRGF